MVSLVMSLPPSEPSLPSIRQDLLDLLTQSEDCYPWNPADPECDAYFDTLESSLALTDTLDTAAMETKAARFFAIANQFWQSDALDRLKVGLWEKFARYIPSSRLDQIFDQAQTLASQNLSTLSLSKLNQLVECVKPLWSQWNEDDLTIIARPLAVVMRGRIALKPAHWDELNEIEQIRLTMMAAQEILTQLEQAQD